MDHRHHPSRRLAVLSRQLTNSCSLSSSSGGAGTQSSDQLQQQQLAMQPTAGGSRAVRSLPKFDPYILETYLDDLREMKRQVYDLFKYKPELLPGPELSKGTTGCSNCLRWVCS